MLAKNFAAFCLLLGTACLPLCQAHAEDALIVERDVPYLADGQSRHEADVYLPRGEGPFPAVLMIHGGAWTSGSKGHMLAHARTVAGAGYAVVAINYRLAPKHPFPAQIEDCRAALRWMRTNRERYKIDATRLAAYGYSAGGHLACLLGTCPTDDPETRVQCVVAGGAPCDFRQLPENAKMLAYWLGGTRGEKPEVYDQASPAAFVTRDDAPTFFFHGDQDFLAPQLNARRMSRLLEAAGVRTEFYSLPKLGHIQAFLNPDAPHEAVKFLDAVLKQQAE